MSSRMFGVLDAAALNSFERYGRHAAGLVAREHGVHLISSFELSSLPLHQLDGLLILRQVPDEKEEDAIRRFMADGGKVVSLDVRFKSARLVYPDFVGAFEQVLQHLRDLGRSRLLFIRGPRMSPPIPTSELRHSSFLEAVEKLGLDFDDSTNTIETNWSVGDAYEKVLARLEKQRDYDAVVCCGDKQAIGAISAARQYGISVPNEIAITGIGNHDVILKYCDIPITSATYPHYNRAYHAMQQLMSEFDEESSSGPDLIPMKLIPRKSTIGDRYNPVSLSSQASHQDVLKLMLTMHDAFSHEEAEALVEEFDSLDNEDGPTAFRWLRDLIVDGIRIGLQPFLNHHLLLHVAYAVDAWSKDRETDFRKRDIEASIVSFSRIHSTYLSRFEDHTVEELDRLLEPLVQLEEHKQTLTDYVAALDDLRRKMMNRRFAIVAFDESVQDLSEYSVRASLWTFESEEAPAIERLTIDQGFDPLGVTSSDHGTVFMDSLPLHTEDGYWGMLYMDCDSLYTLQNRKIQPVISSKLRQSLMFESLRRTGGLLNRRAVELNKQRKLAEAASRAKSEFLAIMSHELRTPLNCILGMTEIALEGEVGESEKDCLQMALTSGFDLLELINDLLDFNLAQNGKLAITKDSIDILDILRTVSTQLESQAEKRGLELRVNFPMNMPPQVYGDSKRLKQVLVNLLSNSIKYTKEGQVQLNVTSKLQDGKATVSFEVRDSGIGMSKDKLEHIFDPFYMVDQSNSRDSGGVGLGLSIVKEIVEKMGGSIYVTSEEGEGTVFMITVPFDVIDEQGVGRSIEGASESREEIEANDSSVKALVVEDNEANALVARIMLEKSGCAVEVVSNGLDAIEAWENDCPDVIFMDIQMPGIDGMDTTRMIREKELEKEVKKIVPIFALTAHATKGYAEKCEAVGMNGCIVKPVSKDELIRAVESSSDFVA